MGEAIDVLEYPANDVLLEQEKASRHVFIIKKGLAKCSQTEANGKGFVQELFGPGEIFGEVEALNESLSFCRIDALTKTEVYRITTPDFLRLLDENKKFNREVLKAISKKIMYKAQRHAFNQSHSLDENFQRLVSEFPEILEAVSKQDIADYLGVSLRSFNRSLQKQTPRNNFK
ncbi:hypothetical protein FUAX_38950 (plasmid) [Fulvitalea axinellae]|uniref:Cyclic nucleotide-binding domain-containing protein n=2 Tax=Fulvitalea axinellae TaxID=1182444 RepID=A0AAU9CTR3_9BACT|nr:hypothetical protein FUAX_38950 [Fulvitalea axinellae]